MVRDGSYYVVVAGMKSILGHQVQIRRTIYDDPIVSVLDLRYDLRQEGPFSQILPCVLSKGLRGREDTGNLTAAKVFAQ